MRRFVLLVMLCLLLTLSAAAQEATPPVEPPSATPAPTDIPTSTPTDLPTNTPTSTDLPSATATSSETQPVPEVSEDPLLALEVPAAMQAFSAASYTWEHRFTFGTTNLSPGWVVNWGTPWATALQFAPSVTPPVGNYFASVSGTFVVPAGSTVTSVVGSPHNESYHYGGMVISVNGQERQCGTWFNGAGCPAYGFPLEGSWTDTTLTIGFFAGSNLHGPNGFIQAVYIRGTGLDPLAVPTPTATPEGIVVCPASPTALALASESTSVQAATGDICAAPGPESVVLSWQQVTAQDYLFRVEPAPGVNVAHRLLQTGILEFRDQTGRLVSSQSTQCPYSLFPFQTCPDVLWDASALWDDPTIQQVFPTYVFVPEVSGEALVIEGQIIDFARPPTPTTVPLTPTVEPLPSVSQRCGPENELWNVQRYNENRPRPSNQQGPWQAHHGIPRSWYLAWFGEAYDRFLYERDITILIPSGAHTLVTNEQRSIASTLGSWANVQWSDMWDESEFVNYDTISDFAGFRSAILRLFKRADTPRECVERWRDRWREFVRRFKNDFFCPFIGDLATTPIPETIQQMADFAGVNLAEITADACRSVGS